MSRKQVCIIPVENLPTAQKFFSDVDRFIAPYLEAVTKSDFSEFFDEVTNYIPEAGDGEDYYFDKKTNTIQNFDVLCDELYAAFDCIKGEIEHAVPIIPGYEISTSKKIDDHSVLITYVETVNKTE